ncbi:hypothetical protein CEXT_653761 [Caerostris extrusa]|uniref:Uncharacterized protein n=1 Tax=Caerostris extrusa TaxID=172846 RepID=A0AAV4NG57_CAEEX|nr:hypothetical protein CEXT_653761 [Caerostris extrusa]
MPLHEEESKKKSPYRLTNGKRIRLEEDCSISHFRLATEGRSHDTDLTTASHDNQSIGFRHVLKMMDNTISHNEHRKGYSFFFSLLWPVG